MVIITYSYGIGTDRGRGRRRRNSETFSNRNASLTYGFFAILAFVAILGVCASTPIEKTSSSKSTKRKLIINGDPARPSDHQFFLKSTPDSFIETNDVLCGASLIHSDIILTSAHCHGGFNYGAMTYNPITQRLDRYTTVDLQIAYPNYYQNLNVINFDLMILRLSSPITDIEPVLLNDDPDFPVRRKNSGETYVLEGLGTGLTETGYVSRGLEVGFFNAMANDQCTRRLGNAYPAITDDIICADPFTDDSICAGDSGGPLTARVHVPESNDGFGGSPWSDNNNIKPVQVGITSFGNDCEVDLIPDGFARISYFHDWITKQICKYSQNPPVECFDYFSSEEYLEYVASQVAEGTIWPDKARITMEFQHDFLAEQTVFVVRNTATNEIQYVGPHYVPGRGDFVVSHFYLPVPGKYEIEIYDNGGNGLTNPDYVDQDYPQGSWRISAEYSNGARLEGLASGDHAFEVVQKEFFSLPRRLPTPTMDPSMMPIPTPMQTTSPFTMGRTSSGVDGVESEPQVSSSSSLSTSLTWASTVLLFSLTGL